MSKELKIPAEGGRRVGGRGQEAGGGDVAAVGGVMPARDVLDDVSTMALVLLLVHALAGGALSLEVSPLGGPWGTW